MVLLRKSLCIIYEQGSAKETDQMPIKKLKHEKSPAINGAFFKGKTMKKFFLWGTFIIVKHDNDNFFSFTGKYVVASVYSP